MAGREGDLLGSDGDAPAAFGLLQNHPNPFNPSTRIRFNAARPGHARLEIFDIAGRRVATLLDEPVAAGLSSLDWNGTDHAGRELPSGLYFSRLLLKKAMSGNRSSSLVQCSLMCATKPSVSV